MLAREACRRFDAKCRLAVAALGFVVAHAAGAAAAETGVTNSSIKIGMFAPTSGPAAIFGKMAAGTRAYIESVSAKGGVNGRKLDIVFEDSACDPARGAAAVKKLIFQDKVFMIVGGLCSNVVLAVKPEIEKAGVPFLVLAATADPIATPPTPYTFQVFPKASSVSEFSVDFALSGGAKKVAILTHSDAWGKSYRAPQLARLKAKYGLKPVANLDMQRGSTNSTPQVLKIKKSRADVVLAFLYPAESVIFLRDAAKYGLKVPIILSPAVSLRQAAARLGSDRPIARAYNVYALSDLPSAPRFAAFRKDLQKFGGEGKKISWLPLSGMASGVVAVEALRRAGSKPTRQKLLNALNNLGDFDTRLFPAPVFFSPKNHAGTRAAAMVHQVNGKLVVVRRLGGSN